MENSKSTYEVRGEALVQKIKELIHEANVRRLVIRSESGEAYLRIPVSVGIFGTLLLPILAVVGALAALAGIFVIEVERGSEEPTAKVSMRKKKIS